MSKLSCAAIVAAASFLAGPIRAQDSPPTQTNTPPAPSIHATVNDVALDVVVRDKKGKLVRNLTAADVQIFEDGVRQDIRNFRLVTGEPLPVGAPDGSATAGTARQPTLPLRSLNLVCIVFQGLDANTRKWAVDAAQGYIKNQLRPGTWVGVFNLGSQLTPLYPFSSNRDELLKAADKAFFGSAVDIANVADAVQNATPNLQLYVGWAAGRTGGMSDKSTTGSLSLTANYGADVDNSPASNAQRGDLVIERQQFIGVEGAKQMDQIKAMVKQLGIFPGHKTVLLFSPGLTTTGDPDQFQAMVNKAVAADVSVYAFDSNGLSQTSSLQASTMALNGAAALSQQQGQLIAGINTVQQNVGPATGSAGYEMGLARQGDYQNNAVRTSDPQAGLRALSEDTGGFLTANSNDLRKPFQQIAGDLEMHYEADYHPTIDKYDGHFHKIEVKLSHPDWKAECRDGYFAIPDRGDAGPLRPFEVAGLMTLNSDPQPKAFKFRSAAFDYRPGPLTQSAVVFQLPGTALTATAQPGARKHRLHASLFAVVKDSSGQIVDTFGKDFLYEIPDDQLARIQAESIDYRHAFRLPAGHYTVESVLLDREAPARRASTSRLEFDSPEAGGVGMSSLMLVARFDPLTAEPEFDDPLVLKDHEIVPMLTGPLTASAKPMLYLVIYPNKMIEEAPRLRVQFLVNGEELEEKQIDLPAPDASGAIPVLVNAATKPGKCELKVTVIQGFESFARSLNYAVAEQ
ncbi:MAG TPA: VWA domain-containing protein [Bryobacteraceae bacterium]|nr:VWA domain-containing protein [Bryobacteraceae bacterium]